MQFPLCDKYGFGNSELIKARLELLGLSQEDIELGKVLHEQVVMPGRTWIVDQFYAFLQNHPDTSNFIKDDEALTRLKITHAEYLNDFGLNFYRQEYFESRLNIGLVHARIRLPLTVYLAAYRLLQSLVIEQIPVELRSDDQQYLTIINLIQKIAMLDMSLATETYGQAQTSSLRDLLIDMYEQREVLSQQVHIDDLTQLPNRKYWLEVLKREMKRTGKAGFTLSIALIDLDHFKMVNDEYGHLVGDRVLKETAARLMGVVRDTDILARFGGEEFVLLMPVTHLDRAVQIVERMRHTMADSPMHIDGHTIPLTLSAGVVEFMDDESMEALIERADKAMYSAKQRGRNRIEY